MGIADKLYERFEKHGVKGGAKQIVRDAASHIVDPNREIFLNRLDLSNPKAHPKKKDRERYDFRVEPFGLNNVDDVFKMLRSSEPWRIDQIKLRVDEKTPGFVTYEDGAVIGYVFYVDATNGPQPYSDLKWLGIEIRDKEIYSFDSFIPVELRGRGIPMYRRTYLALHEAGHTTGYGYVYGWNKAARFSYKVMGWKEYHSFTEHRVLGRFVIVDGVLYKMNRFDRERLVAIPFGDRLHAT